MCFHETSELKGPFSCIQSFWISKWFWIGHCIDSLAKEPKETQKDPKTNPKTNGTDSTTNANQLQRAVALRKSPKFSKLGGHHPTSNLALSCTVLSGRTIWFFGLSASTNYPPSSERLSAHCPIYCQRHSIFACTMVIMPSSAHLVQRIWSEHFLEERRTPIVRRTASNLQIVWLATIAIVYRLWKSISTQRYNRHSHIGIVPKQ